MLINKVDTAAPDAVRMVRENVRRTNPGAVILEAASPIRTDAPSVLTGKRVLAIEDGPTVTHGGMRYGAATLAAREHGATLIDPRPYAVGEITQAFVEYPELGPILPAMGYGEQKVQDLEATIARAVAAGVEAVCIGTPIHLARLVRIGVPYTRVRYDLEERGTPSLADVLASLTRDVASEPRRPQRTVLQDRIGHRGGAGDHSDRLASDRDDDHSSPGDIGPR